MMSIEVHTLTTHDKNKVYNILKNLEEFPKFMRDVKKIEVLEKGVHRLVTSWEVDVEGAIVAWKEEDIFDDEKLRMKFKMLEGDYGMYFGEWAVTNINKKTKINLLVHIDWDIPAFEKVINGVIEKKQKRILRSMLIAMKNYL